MAQNQSSISIVTIYLSCFLLIPLLMSCTSNITQYSQTTPQFDMATFFNGELSAYGMVQDRSGKVIRRFEAELLGTWNDERGILEEDFLYDDGEKKILF